MYETGSMLAIDAARYKVDSRLHPRDKAAQSSYGAAQFFIPRLAAYPHWFVVQATRTGHPRSTSYLVFERSSVVGGWKVSLAVTALAGTKLPRLATARGQAVAGQPRGLTVLPDRLPAAHADLLAKGSASSSFERLRLDQATTRLRAQDENQRIVAGATGLLQLSYQPAPLKPYVLQTSDGGALVLYVITAVSDLKPKTVFAGVEGGAAIEVLAGQSGIFRSLNQTRMEQFAAWVPKSGKARVLAYEGGLTAAVLTGRIA